MTDTLTPDPFGEARARAINALKSRWVDSLKVGVIAWVTVTLTTAGVVAAMVPNMLDSHQAWTAILAVLLATGPVAIGGLEIRRLLERSESLIDLRNATRQYETLIADARAERDQMRQQLTQAEQIIAALQLALFASRKEGNERGGQ